MDTNIFLHHFEVLTQFVEDVERLSLPVIVIVPGAVIYELDGYVFHTFDDGYQIDAMHSGNLLFIVNQSKKTRWHGMVCTSSLCLAFKEDQGKKIYTRTSE